MDEDEALECFPEAPSREDVRARLGGLWRSPWTKAKAKNKAARHPARPYRSGEHKSVARLRAEHQAQEESKRKKADRIAS